MSMTGPTSQEQPGEQLVSADRASAVPGGSFLLALPRELRDIIIKVCDPQARSAGQGLQLTYFVSSTLSPIPQSRYTADATALPSTQILSDIQGENTWIPLLQEMEDYFLHVSSSTQKPRSPTSSIRPFMPSNA